MPCLSYSKGIRVWEDVCDSCGAKQKELLKELQSKITARKAQAEDLLSEYDFSTASSIATSLLFESDSRLEGIEGWVEQFLKDVKSRHAREVDRIRVLANEAIQHEQLLDYVLVQRELEFAEA